MTIDINKRKLEEVYPRPKEDRRFLSYVPDPTHKRQQVDRRGIPIVGSKSDGRETHKYINEINEAGIRYYTHTEVEICTEKENKKFVIKGDSVDLSVSGILAKISKEDAQCIDIDDEVTLKFKIPKGAMQEGYENKVKIRAKVMRYADEKKTSDDGELCYIGFMFNKSLAQYFSKKKWISEITISSIFLGIIVFMIMLMRLESVIYFKYNVLLYGYSILTATYLLSRYLFGAAYKIAPVDIEYTPGVSVVIPCFNEETWIHKTIISCLNQDYPVDKLEVIVVDDCSNDNSVEKIEEIIKALKRECVQYHIEDRIKFIQLKENSGKRVALVKGVEASKHELVTFVDSDSFLQPTAIRNLVQPFRDPKVGGVTGRTDVENKWTNYITKMQAVRYYVAFRIIKAAEAVFDAVTCLSGPISCYRKELVEENKEAWLNQKFFGQPATFGDDRSMTNFILRHHRTTYQDTAICTTIVPSEFKSFLKQQMRWKRSWLRESLRAGIFMWRKEPFQALSFYAGIIVPILAPIVVIYNLVYVPLVYNIFPTMFITGILLMSLLMSFVYLWFRKSRIWIYGLVFCLFYEFILLWQMPIACVTFWKSTWGTRKTKEDIEADFRKQEKKRQRKIEREKKKEKRMKDIT